MHPEDLRIGLLAGTLGTGGAEKQLVYMVKALRDSGVAVAVYSLTRGERHERSLRDLDQAPEWVGRFQNPVLRVLALGRRLRRFRPHIVQSAHFYTNLHVALAARLCGAMSVGAVRNDGALELEDHPVAGRALLSWPDGLIANSVAAQENLARLAPGARAWVLPNVIDVAEFDTRAAAEPEGIAAEGARRVAVVVARLEPVKRLDRFLRALAAARKVEPALQGWVVGEGPERSRLESLARELGLVPEAVRFLGHRTDVPALLARAHMLVLTSDQEGFPNVVLEAMAAGLPVVTTAAGDAAQIVRDGFTGYVVAFDDLEALARHMLVLASDASLRRVFGAEGRHIVESEYGCRGLVHRLLGVHVQIARNAGRRRLEERLATRAEPLRGSA